MFNMTAKQPHETAPSSGNPLLNLFLQTLVAGLVLTALLFLAAGRVDWPFGWVFVVLWFVTKLVYLLTASKHDPELMAERANKHANTEEWDRIIIPVYLVFAFLTVAVAGLDAGRFQWSSTMPPGIPIAGLVVYLTMNALAGWAMIVNTYHSSVSRIQSDRGHKVVMAGPYRYLRHPTYLASLLIWLSTPFVLESWWALIPGALAGAMMALRAALEDRMLCQELPGYAEYAERVRYRLLPGLW